MSRVASIIHKWKKLGTTRVRGLSQGGGQESKGHSVRASEVLFGEENLPEGQPSL